MRAINHAVTGAVIGAAVANPWVALISHLVLDVIPHSGEDSHTSQRFYLTLIIDAAMTLAFLLAIVLLRPDNWQLIFACAVVATAPDVWWAPYWIQEVRGKRIKLDPIGSFLSKIQWSETTKGYYVEAAWLLMALYLFFMLTAY